MPQNLIRRKNNWYVRVAVPRPLWDVVGCREKQRTTKTSDLKLAELRKHRIIADLRDEIETMANNDPASPGWLRRIGEEFRNNVLHGRMTSEQASDIMSDLQETHLKALGTSKDDPFVPEHQVSRLVSAHRYATDMDYSPLSGYIDRYLAERKPVVVASTYATKDRTLNGFKDWLKDDPDSNEINRKITGRYVTDVLVGNGKAPKTNTDTITCLSSFWNWMIRRGTYDHPNPWTGLGQTITGSTRGKKLQLRRWTDGELATLFQDIPSGAKYYLREVCAVAVYTGMRLAEIADLEVTDIDLEAETIHVSEGKTQSSVRDVPIHSKLLPVIVQLIDGRAEGYLFATLKPTGSDLSRGHEVSKRFGYWRDHAFPDTLHVINDKGHKRSEVNFHSFRRAFINACELAGIPEPTTKQIVGHSRSSMSYGTYSKGVDLKLLREAIEKVDYEGVTLERV